MNYKEKWIELLEQLNDVRKELARKSGHGKKNESVAVLMVCKRITVLF
jgi:hypothetical protein